MARHFKHHDKAAIIQLLTDIRARPADFLHDEVLGKIAAVFADQPEERHFQSFDLLEAGGQLKIYGSKEIEQAARQQMEVAMSLPVTVQGALMPDAHMGYGLPVGGVLATEQAVIPYAVGVDIGCRMALTLFDEGESFLKRYRYQLEMAIKAYTHFGMEGGLEFRQEHPVLDRPEFHDTPLLKSLHGKAVRQLGSSGSGNHFVEFGLLTLEEDNSLSLPPKRYLALLSHSGSRGLGAAIAQHYTKIATDTCKLPRSAQQLAWLDMNSEAGQEYWLSMNLAGDYARACHQQIHRHLAKAAGLKSLATIENHHNFAWEETLTDKRKVVIHRKGATPAHAGELGIIPGSMTTPAYLVRGKGAEESLYSAAHGAGRAMSRSKAREKMTVSALKKIVAGAGVTLIGGSVEENPLAYKDIDRVMDAQRELVQVEGRFMPAIVRMNNE
ncbi:RtcB family protein [Chitinophaga oryzae]|uniref:3'-phosphate/5'-hydroxy nucleic acid ligase n=2 Tax=Chitinophaga oryzae TaxID=2725414 RepID=A0AAE6ZPQ6_9BACT|nr:RtcB family protein [Chitinophaga oryzae]